MKTRTKKPLSKSNSSNPQPNIQTTTRTLPPPISKPPHITILPQTLSPSARILTLPHPATATPSRYLIDAPSRRCYEFTRVAAPKRSCRSWLLAPERRVAGGDAAAVEEEDTGSGDGTEGYVVEKADLMVATPIDPLFLILPALAADGVEGKQMFLSGETYLDRLEESSPQFRQLLRSDEHVRKNVEAMFETRMAAVCDCMDIGDGEMLYRLSLPKLLGVMVEKARRIVEAGLFPPSMEERFVRQALAVPVLSVRREESSVSFADQESQAGAGPESEVASSEASTSQPDSQESGISTAASISTAATSISASSQPDTLLPIETKDNNSENHIPHLLRLRTILDYQISSYIPPPLQSSLTTALSSSSSSSSASIDFTPLTTHLNHLSTLRKEAQTLRSLSDNISRKRANIDEDDDEVREMAEAKKRKKEEEEIRRKNVSRGVKALEKVDRSGMRTLSSFFGAKPAAGKKG